VPSIVNNIANADQFEINNLDASLLASLSPHRIDQRLAEFEPTSWPPVCSRTVSALPSAKENFSVSLHHHADTYGWPNHVVDVVSVSQLWHSSYLPLNVDSIMI
jgi:hypothetical protein